MKKTTLGLMAMILVSLTGNVYQYSSEDLPDNFTHVCVEDETITQVSWCHHLSGGQETRCYQTESSRSDWKVCNTGWQEAQLINNQISHKKQRIICPSESCK